MGFNFNVTSDKIILESGAKQISPLSGSKTDIDLVGTTDKIMDLAGQKNITELTGTKNITELTGTKYITELSGTKTNELNYGSLDKVVNVVGSDVADGYWHIFISETYYTADNTILTVDRN